MTIVRACGHSSRKRGSGGANVRDKLPSLVLLLIFALADAGRSDTTVTSPPAWKPSPTGAALRSLLLPGWGQAYDRRPLKAVIVGGIEEGFIYGVYRQHQLFRDARGLRDESSAKFYREQRNRLTWMLAGAIIFSVVDAYVDAHLYGFEVSEQLSDRGLRVGGVNVGLGGATP